MHNWLNEKKILLATIKQSYLPVLMFEDAILGAGNDRTESRAALAETRRYKLVALAAPISDQVQASLLVVCRSG